MSNCILLPLIFLSFLDFSSPKLSPKNVELAINCGGAEFKSKSGVVYQKDNFFNGGETSEFGRSFDIKNTKDVDLYQTERWSSSDLIYRLPLTKEGKYVLILKFSEVYFSNVKEKVFNVKLGDSVVIKNLDIFDKAGKSAAYDEYIPFTLKGDKIILTEGQKEMINAYEGGKLVVTFGKTDADNPKINAILLVRGKLDDTDYYDYKKQREILQRKKEEEERKNREFKRMSKSIDFEEFEDDFVDDGKKYRMTGSIFSGSSLAFYAVVFFLGYLIFFSGRKGRK